MGCLTKQKRKLPPPSFEFCQSPQNIQLIIFSFHTQNFNILFLYGTQIISFQIFTFSFIFHIVFLLVPYKEDTLN